MQPLAAQLRSQNLSEFFGQEHLLGQGKPLYLAITHQKLHSMILWGPPGTGKTTLAHMLAQSADCPMAMLSAVLAGVKDIRAVVETAKKEDKPTLLFIDEIHRFNKSQQDALLPFVEDGTLILVGATTENPSFECNPALLSRCRVYVLKALTEPQLSQILQRALSTIEAEHGPIKHDDASLQMIIDMAQGDARRMLNYVDVIIQWLQAHQQNTITAEIVKKTLDSRVAHFDKQGEQFYDQISALHKAVRGSSVDGALYWLSRMLQGGVDPSYLSRRIVRMSMEDIGNADPKALTLALDAANAMERLGSPEGEIALAQAVVYMAIAPKSNAVYKAFNAAWDFAKHNSHQPVPLHLRNAPTKLMKSLDYGKAYQYDHDFPSGVAFSQTYFPEGMKPPKFYQPTSRGYETKISDKLNWLNEHREKTE